MNDSAVGCVPSSTELVAFLNEFDSKVSALDAQVSLLGNTVSKLKALSEVPEINEKTSTPQQAGLINDLSNVLNRFTRVGVRLSYMNEHLTKII
jgi:hypothetical protein